MRVDQIEPRFLSPPCRGAVHVWWADLARLGPSLPHLQDVLSADERERSERLRAERPRRQAVAAQGLLRLLLAAYLREGAEAVRLAAAPRGRPFLAPVTGRPVLDFNLSHSGELVAIAVTDPGPVGIDLEAEREAPNAARLAARFFAPAEHEAIAALPSADRARAFFHCWTLKEAYLKATGEGLAGGGLGRVVVDPDPNRPPRLLRIGESASAPREWTALRLELPVAATCSLVVRGRPSGLEIRDAAAWLLD